LELDSESGEVTRAALIAVDKPPLSLPARQSDEVLASTPRHMKDSPFSYAVDIPKLVETLKAVIGPGGE
jgi:hypothetical protein